MTDAITIECPAITEAILKECFADTPTGKHNIIDILPPIEIVWDELEGFDELDEVPTQRIILSSLGDQITLPPAR